MTNNIVNSDVMPGSYDIMTDFLKILQDFVAKKCSNLLTYAKFVQI